MKKILFLFGALLLIIGCSGGDTMNRHVIFETSMGEIEIEMFEDKMPVTTANFIGLVEQGFYDATRFHRVIGPAKAPPNGFMIQGGDPLSKDLSKRAMWGTGGGESIKDEFHAETSNVRGTLAMANAGPNTGSSQFFINLNDNSFLDFNKPPAQSKHPVFGRVVSGMDVVEAIGNVETGRGDQPVEDVLIEKARVK